jgi:glutamyl-tRNA reductase
MELGYIGTNYKQLAISEMERFYFAKEGLADFLDYSHAHSPIIELVPLLTCNRMEYYMVAPSLTEAAEWIYNEIASRKEQPLTDVRSVLPHYSDDETMCHLFNVSSGLESMVFGENEILSQVKAAYLNAKDQKLTGRLLNKLFQSAVACGKRVRSETKISQGAYSVSSIAIDAIKSHHLDYFGRRILIIGMGAMGKRCLKKLHALGHPDITVVNRSIDKARQVSDELGYKYRPFETLSEELHHYDIIISAISRKQVLITADNFNSHSKTSLIIDLGVPRNVKPDGHPDHRTIISVDGLKALAEKNVKRRQGEVIAATVVIEDEYSKFQNWMNYKRELTT